MLGRAAWGRGALRHIAVVFGVFSSKDRWPRFCELVSCFVPQDSRDTSDAPKPIRPHCLGNVQVIKKLSEYRGTNIRTIEQAELAILLSKPHFKVKSIKYHSNSLPDIYIITIDLIQFQALIEAHDKIGALWISRLLSVACSEDIIDNSVFVGDDGEMPAKDAVKIVGIRKHPDQPLGLTVNIYFQYVRLYVSDSDN